MSDKGVAAVERALAILDCFESDQESLPLKTIAQKTGLYKSTILRLCVSLESYGYLRRREDGDFQLGPTLWRLGALYRNRFDVATHVRPVLKRLSETTGESASFYVRDGDARICLMRHNSSQAIRHHLEEGVRLPLNLGAAGHLIQAYTDGSDPKTVEIKACGYAISLGERDPNTVSIAVPVLGRGDAFMGALVVSGLGTRFDEAARHQAIELAQDEARRLSQEIYG
ncbi:MAG TPA: IclR family transcriptional regulator [Rhodospirillaceae bacterium]|nr:IclR family transcriptional regulator [Rhodospirillaceae bacterium]MAX62361.1 IclR family transcriptional regulator [Rhodospirillaceae bacterium]MBB56250.1 IclR family transcriptional regulator [Rhodospirillaceae bacterium]HAE00929.1 IclR family transcriptional regulator [Rhodospirillaceae bacterium]|tara:strand:+ start:27321 stop:28001 length:681 start_codon:yes stop_codon:yes gene_type:complete